MTPERNREADNWDTVFQVALARQGAKALAGALGLWRSVPTDVQEPPVAWLRAALRFTQRERGKARALAWAYYRLVRALRTDFTVTTDRPGGTVSLGELRDEFTDFIDFPYRPFDTEDAVVKLERPTRLERVLEERERAAMAEARSRLASNGPLDLRDRLADVDPKKVTGEELDSKRTEAHQQSGRKQAAALERSVLNAGRDVTEAALQTDDRLIGYARASSTGTPCGFCAMLISRGPVYISKASASEKREGGQYHDNCRCYPIPVFSEEQYEFSESFALNREYSDLWPKVTKGLRGKAALAAWRKHFREMQARAQEERTPTTAQEAAA